MPCTLSILSVFSFGTSGVLIDCRGALRGRFLNLKLSIAKDAFLYGMPLVAQYKTMYAFSIQDNPLKKGRSTRSQLRARL
jgi:hypothetical protein